MQQGELEKRRRGMQLHRRRWRAGDGEQEMESKEAGGGGEEERRGGGQSTRATSPYTNADYAERAFGDKECVAGVIPGVINISVSAQAKSTLNDVMGQKRGNQLASPFPHGLSRSSAWSRAMAWNPPPPRPLSSGCALYNESEGNIVEEREMTKRSLAMSRWPAICFRSHASYDGNLLAVHTVENW
ncbi:hypothetical protein LIA77_04144 [Sarocladium implicatum]|nr:hypothetical protein LIA77_04144 [Sarocladium implicatum]